MGTLRVGEIFSKSNNELPNSNVSVQEDLFASVSLQSVFLVCSGEWFFKGQWRKKWEVDSTSITQLQKGLIQFWKVWLNLCLCISLSPRQSCVTNLIPLCL